MEVSNMSQNHLDHAPREDSQPFAPMNGDMDIDMDIDIQPGEEEMAAIEAEAMNMESRPSEALIPTSNSTPTQSTDPGQVAAHKVYLRGLDRLHTGDIKQFASEHFDSLPPIHIEWIDDTSANLVYDTPETALEALNSFSSSQNQDASVLSPLQSRTAKTLSTHTDSQLEARLAVLGDRKQPKARERSRFYLFHPEHDPGERRRRDGRDRRRGDRFEEHTGDYQRRRYDDREERRRRDREEESGFDANMYDDDSSALATRDRKPLPHSASTGDERRGSPRELFPHRVSRRGRSASPMRDQDGDEAMDRKSSRLRSGRLRERSYTPPSYRHRSNSPPRPARSNSRKELFPVKSSSKDISTEIRGGLSPGNPNKELFPNRTTISNHRRSGAFDAADETADIFATHMSVPFTDGSREIKGRGKASRSLADRIGKDTASTAPPSQEEQQNAGFSIRGAAAQQDQGFSIRGSSSSSHALDGKELFPSKLMSSNNAGKELFAEKLDGRGGRRNKAADMFY